MRFLVVLLLLQASAAASAQEWSSATCGASLGHAYSFFATRRDAAATQGDFNSDGTADFAVLLEGKASPHKAAIGVCLSNEPRPLLITSPYVSAKIFTKPRGTEYMDFDSESAGVYEHDAISVSDGACCGASYILRSGVFVQVIDSD
jgi:hypothetical protein